MADGDRMDVVVEESRGRVFYQIPRTGERGMCSNLDKEGLRGWLERRDDVGVFLCEASGLNGLDYLPRQGRTS